MLKPKWIIALSIAGVMLLTGMIFITYIISTSNTEVSLRTLIEAKQLDNTSEYDNMWKKISQVAQVTNAQKDSLKEIFVSYAEARTSDGGGSIAKWIQESVPNVDTTIFNNLQNIITGSRDSWTQRQKELIDIHREHTQLMRKFPSSMILSFMGRKEIEIKVITSTRTTEVFENEKDDNVDVFNNKNAEKN
jgi:hypothetical protein